MTMIRLAVGLSLSILVAACDSSSRVPQAQNTAKEATETEATIYSGAGTITAIAGDQVTISHGPIEGLGWPAMAMTFRAPKAEMIADSGVGDRVSFAFRKDGGGYTLTTLSRSN